MCGIAGLLYKNQRTGPIGETLLRMLDVLGSRGVDGTGVALYRTPEDDALILRVKLDASAPIEEQAAGIENRVDSIATVRRATVQADYLRLVVSGNDDVVALTEAVEQGHPGVEVFSVGREMEIVKQVGPAQVLRDDYLLSTFQGTHGIGHTRLATESRVDISHCHPFWARPYPDIAVVHNGQITNYRTLRRFMETRGVQFHTDNDSEIIGLYIAEKLQAGATLEEALRRSVDDLDGTFTYLVSTPEGIGMAKDFFASKPLIVADTDDWVAIASEEVALCDAFGSALQTYQPPARQVHVWQRAASVVAAGV